MPLFRLHSPGPFFDNKVRAFWNLQLLGWAAWLGLRGVSALANGQPFTFLVPQTISAITGFSLTLIGTILGEMFAAQHGLGYLLMNAIGLYNVDVIMAVTFLLVVFAASVNAALLAIDRRLHFRA